MSEARVTLADPAGLHARQAAGVVRIASRFEARVCIGHAGQTADGRSLLELLSLGAGPGTELTLVAEGPEADAALAALTLDLVSPSPEPGGGAVPTPSSARDG
jgi:phosphotransferase system HPr (HPr) family protein